MQRARVELFSQCKKQARGEHARILLVASFKPMVLRRFLTWQFKVLLEVF